MTRPAKPAKFDPAQWLLHALLLALLALSLYPVLSMLQLSFKNPLQWNDDRWMLSFPLRVSNYAVAWEIIRPYLLNTVLVGVVSGVVGLFLASLSAFVFARLKFPGREFLYYLVIALLMVPGILSLVPQFMLYKNLGILNNYWALIVPGFAGLTVFGVFLLRTFFASIPEELFESARMDGATVMQLYWRICIPLSLPILLTLAIMHLVSTWNSFIWPSVAVQDDRYQMVSVGLVRLTERMTTVAAGDAGAWGPLFAGYVIAALPLFLIFTFASRYYVEGLISSGLKL